MSHVGYIAQRSTNPNLVLSFLRELPPGTLESRAEIIPNYKAVKAKYKLRSPKMVKSLLRLGVNEKVLSDYYSHNPTKILENCDVRIWHEFNTPGCSAVMKQQSDSTHFRSCMRSGAVPDSSIGEYYNNYIDKEIEAFERGVLGMVVIGEPYNDVEVSTPLVRVGESGGIPDTNPVVSYIPGDRQGFKGRAKIRVMYNIEELHRNGISVLTPTCLYVDRVYSSVGDEAFIACVAQHLRDWWKNVCVTNDWVELPIYVAVTNNNTKCLGSEHDNLTYFGESYEDSLADGAEMRRDRESQLLYNSSMYVTPTGKTLIVGARSSGKQHTWSLGSVATLDEAVKQRKLQLLAYKQYRYWNVNQYYEIDSPGRVYTSLQNNSPSLINEEDRTRREYSGYFEARRISRNNVIGGNRRNFVRAATKAQFFNDVRECLTREFVNACGLQVEYVLDKYEDELVVTLKNQDEEKAKLRLSLFITPSNINNQNGLGVLTIGEKYTKLILDSRDSDGKICVVPKTYKTGSNIRSNKAESFLNKRKRGFVSYVPSVESDANLEASAALESKFTSCCASLTKIVNFYRDVLDM